MTVPQPKLIVSYPGGNPNVLATLRALQDAGMLAKFCTTLAWKDDSVLMTLLPPALRGYARRRSFPGIDPALIVRFPAQEISRQILRQLGLAERVDRDTGWASVYGVANGLDRKVAAMIRRSNGAAGVYTYEHCATQSFAAARERGVRRFYELTTGYWREAARLFSEEPERNPEWAMTLETLRDSPAIHAAKDAELANADHIVVPSDYARDTLRQHPSLTATIDVVPYGAPPPVAAPHMVEPLAPLRLLYVGNLTQNKGISYLFGAMRHLQSAATLTLVGSLPSLHCPALTTALQRHRWLGHRPHDEVLEVMRQHDVMVFPSLFEGFGLVILEAMAQGLPVITTPNGGGPMVIEHGVDGFIVPARDEEAIADCVLSLSRDHGRLAAMKLAALEKARRLSWASYEAAFLGVIRKRLGLC